MSNQTGQLYRVGERGPVVRPLGTSRRGLQMCTVVEPGNLQDDYGMVTHWMAGTVVMVKADALAAMTEATDA